MWVRVGVLEKDLARVTVGTPVEVSLVAHPGEVFRTTVSAVAPYLDPTTHLASVWAELKNPAGAEPRILPGMAGRADVVLLGEKPRATVPVAAVAREGVDRFVFVEEASAAGAVRVPKEVRCPRAEERRPRRTPRRRGVPGRPGGGPRVSELSGLFAPGVFASGPRRSDRSAFGWSLLSPGAVDETVTLDGAIDSPPPTAVGWRHRSRASSPPSAPTGAGR